MDYLDFPAGTERIIIKYHFVQIVLRVVSDNGKDQFLKSTFVFKAKLFFFFLKLHLKSHKRYIAENN